MAFWGDTSFQNLMSHTSSHLESLHDLVMVWLAVILFVVLFLSFKLLKGGSGTLHLDSLLLEQVWTLIPMLILISVAYPSLHLLCLQDSFSFSPADTLHVISSQWSWQSEGGELVDHLLDQEKLDELASYEAPMLMSSSSLTRVLVSSTDVLHSLGLPSIGVKLDSVPGRLNATMVEAVPGLTLGSCFELCGSGHSAMPIFLFCV